MEHDQQQQSQFYSKQLTQSHGREWRRKELKQVNLQNSILTGYSKVKDKIIIASIVH